MKTIPLTRGMVAVVDDADYEHLSRLKWHAVKGWRDVWYGCHAYIEDGRVRHVAMHCYLLQTPPGMQVDHVNGDGLDNRRENLRTATPSQNQANRIRLTSNTSGFRGVTYNRKSGRWQAQIKCKGKNYYLGLFDHAEDAARAYDAKAGELFGAFARLNFPTEDSAA